MASLEQAVVNIRTTGGTLRTLQLESSECCVTKLKQNISTEFQIPVEFQTLVGPSGVLEEHDVIAKDAELTLVISLEKFCASLGHCAALEALPTIVHKGDEHAIIAVTARLEHMDEDVRCAALEALPKIANKEIVGLLDWKIARTKFARTS